MDWKNTVAHIKRSNIIVNPSYSEGLPTSLVEAALCRRAIVATAVGGTNEIVRHNVSALLVPAGEPQKLAQALQQLLEHPANAEQLAQAAYYEVSQRFTWAQSAAAYVSLLKKL